MCLLFALSLLFCILPRSAHYCWSLTTNKNTQYHTWSSLTCCLLPPLLINDDTTRTISHILYLTPNTCCFPCCCSHWFCECVSMLQECVSLLFRTCLCASSFFYAHFTRIIIHCDNNNKIWTRINCVRKWTCCSFVNAKGFFYLLWSILVEYVKFSTQRQTTWKKTHSELHIERKKKVRRYWCVTACDYGKCSQSYHRRSHEHKKK